MSHIGHLLCVRIQVMSDRRLRSDAPTLPSPAWLQAGQASERHYARGQRRPRAARHRGDPLRPAYVTDGHQRQTLDLYLPQRRPSDPIPLIVWIHGDRELLVPYGQSVILADALAAVGVPHTLYTVAGAGHGGFTDPAVPELIRTLLAERLGPEA